MTETRAVCLNCIDGRVQIPVIHWIKQHCQVDHVDMVTEPGMNGLLANEDHPIESIIKKLRLSIDNNNARVIVIVGHYDCRGNPVIEALHREQIRLAVERVQKAFGAFDLIGLWVNEKWKAERVGH
jgi:carbonic anhydrase